MARFLSCSPTEKAESKSERESSPNEGGAGAALASSDFHGAAHGGRSRLRSSEVGFDSSGKIGVKMKRIVNGSVSGFLPSTEAFSVNYPGYPSSMSRAIETLRGTEEILKAHLSQSKLKLYFRPEDPFSHPAFGEHSPCNSLVLKLCKKRLRNDQNVEDETSRSGNGLMLASHLENVDESGKVETRSPEEGQIGLYADIIAHTRCAYNFNGMADYQHVVSVHANVAKRRRFQTDLEKPGFEKGHLMDVDQDDVMILVPPLFSLKDEPENLVLKTPALSTSKKKQEIIQNHHEVNMEPVLAIDFNIIEIPKIVNWEEYIPKGSEQWESQMVVTKLFEERPIWPKDSLVEKLLEKGLNCRHEVIRRLLSRIAYYFSSGPFLRFWIIKGYDPRKHPESRIYQRIDFRVPQPLRSYCESFAANKLKHRRSDICSFQVFPYKLQTSLQCFELADDYIQEEIRKPSTEATCSYGTGWFSQHRLNCLRQRLMVRFLSVFPEAGAGPLLRAASEKFSKLKRGNEKDYLKLLEEEDEDQQQKTDDVGVDDKDKPNYVEDDIDDESGEEELDADDVGVDDKDKPNYVEDDIDDESGEEELDARQTFDMDGEDDEDGEISLQSHSHRIMDGIDISRSHLQELFGSFPPITEDGDKAEEGVDTSEDEYQIYEQEDSCGGNSSCDD